MILVAVGPKQYGAGILARAHYLYHNMVGNRRPTGYMTKGPSVWGGLVL
jgi:hypothetical protein